MRVKIFMVCMYAPPFTTCTRSIACAAASATWRNFAADYAGIFQAQAVCGVANTQTFRILFS